MPPAEGLDAGSLLLSSRLSATGAPHLAVHRFLGQTAIARLFVGHDAREGRAVTIKLVDSDLAYDVGGAEFVRGIGNAQELAAPHVLPPGPGVRGALCYVGSYAPAEPLRAHLSHSQPIRFTRALQIAAETARAMEHWHALGLAHGDVRQEKLLIQRGQVVLSPPDTLKYGWEAQGRDVEALARLCIELLEASVRAPEEERWWEQLRVRLARAAGASGSRPLSARRLADWLTETEYRTVGPERGRAGPLGRFLRTVYGWLKTQRADFGWPPPDLPFSFCGFLRGKPYVVRLVEPRAPRKGAGHWRLEMLGVPPILFAATRGDTEESVRAAAERQLLAVLPED